MNERIKELLKLELNQVFFFKNKEYHFYNDILLENFKLGVRIATSILTENSGWVDIDNPPKKSGRYLCQLKLRDGITKIEINYLFSDDNDYNKKFLGVTHWQYLPDEVESENAR